MGQSFIPLQRYFSCKHADSPHLRLYGWLQGGFGYSRKKMSNSYISKNSPFLNLLLAFIAVLSGANLFFLCDYNQILSPVKKL